MEFAVEIIEDAPAPEGDDCSVTRALLEALLTQDDALRSQVSSFRCFSSSFSSSSSLSSLLSLDDLRDLSARLQSAPLDVWAVVPTPHFRARRRRTPQQQRSGELSPLQQAKLRTRERFPHLQELLSLGHGRVVAAGAAMMLMALDTGHELVFQQQHGHCELFFHHIVSEDEANALLTKMVSILSAAGNSVETPRCKVLLTRTASMVQVSLCCNSYDSQWGDSEAIHYRFRLRLFSSIEEIVFQTELGPCGIAFGADEGFVMTPLAAFNLATRSIIADPGVRRSSVTEWYMQLFLDRGFCVLLPSLPEKLTTSDGAQNNVAMRTGQGGRTRGEILSLAQGLIKVGREDDRENHRHNFGHAPRRLLLVNDLPPNSSFRPHDSLITYSYLNIHHICQDENSPLVTLTGDSLDDLVNRPCAFGFDKVDEIFAERDIPLSRAKLLFGPDAIRYASAFLDKDPEIDDLIVRAKARVRDRLEAAQKPGLLWERSNGWNFVPCTMSPRAWYPAGLYEPTLSGLPRLFAPVFRQLRCQHAGFRSLPSDVLKLLMRSYIMPVIAADVIKDWLSKARVTKLPDLGVSCSESETITSEGD